ncbi:uncharacterized protein TRIREDRAFT_112215 [Trichoderma reesei QM6a]|uniref:Predicted protein n=1 Tax=Hypocrea jecorina (strain QM6a) TaxID=431241 RepID=G0RWH8_HYPJQ|nr:uncharacterized protein TRIREDRAFT_112215 [Trichoderma reesei QM6a]EGR44503.1 predicted protein [Trichoderma reesei QM6a]
MPVRLAAASRAGFLLLQSRGLDRQSLARVRRYGARGALIPSPRVAPFRFPHRGRHDGASNPIPPACMMGSIAMWMVPEAADERDNDMDISPVHVMSSTACDSHFTCQYNYSTIAGLLVPTASTKHRARCAQSKLAAPPRSDRIEARDNPAVERLPSRSDAHLPDQHWVNQRFNAKGQIGVSRSLSTASSLSLPRYCLNCGSLDARAEGHRVESSRVRSSPAAQQLKHLAFVTARKDGAGPSLRFAVSGRRGLRACLGSEASKPTNHPGRLFLGSPTPKRLAARRLHRITREPCRRKGFQCARWSREGIITSLHARPLVCKGLSTELAAALQRREMASTLVEEEEAPQEADLRVLARCVLMPVAKNCSIRRPLRARSSRPRGRTLLTLGKPLLLGYGPPAKVEPAEIPEDAAFEYESRVCHSGGRNGILGLLTCRTGQDAVRKRTASRRNRPGFTPLFAKSSDSSSMASHADYLTTASAPVDSIETSPGTSYKNWVLPLLPQQISSWIFALPSSDSLRRHESHELAFRMPIQRTSGTRPTSWEHT